MQVYLVYLICRERFHHRWLIINVDILTNIYKVSIWGKVGGGLKGGRSTSKVTSVKVKQVNMRIYCISLKL